MVILNSSKFLEWIWFPTKFYNLAQHAERLLRDKRFSEGVYFVGKHRN